MTELLIRRFIKNGNNSKEPAVRAAYGKFAGAIGIILNVFLFLIKLTAGILGGISVSVVADAVNNLSDASSSIVNLMGFRLAEKPADKEHPYGHGRYEYLSALTVSAIILVIGFELARSGIGRIIAPEIKDFSSVTLITLILSIIIKTWMYFFNKKVGKIISSDSLRASAKDSLNDVITTSAVLAASIASPIIGFDLDGYMALAVSVFILISGVGLIKDTIAPLLGSAPDPEFVEYIEKKILSYPNVLGIHDLMIHDYGPGRMYGTVHVEMPSELDILKGHDIADRIEHDFFENDHFTMTIHYDPIVRNDPLTDGISAIIKSELKKINEEIKFHDMRTVPMLDRTNVIFDIVLPYSDNLDKKEIKRTLEDAVNTQYENISLVINFERSYVG